jgi:hypothetical protein
MISLDTPSITSGGGHLKLNDDGSIIISYGGPGSTEPAATRQMVDQIMGPLSAAIATACVNQ